MTSGPPTGTYAGYNCKKGDILIAINAGNIPATKDNWDYQCDVSSQPTQSIKNNQF